MVTTVSSQPATAEDDALADLVTRRVRQSGTSFYWAMRMMAPERRLAMYAVYAFCRDVDDIVDEPGETDEKRRRLALWRDDIALLYRGGRPDQPLARALARPIRTFALVKEDFIAVIDGCDMDTGAGVVRPDMATLDLYCDRVACAVGRLSVRIFGDFRDRSLDVANHQGRALQLTNILRDVKEDARIGRVYLPDELLTRHGITDTDPAAIANHPRIALVCRDLSVRARDHFTKTAEAMADCSHRSMRPAAVMMAMYREIFDRLEQRGWQPPDRLKISKPRKIWCVLRYGLF
jgi:phytoene synthase